MIEWARSIQASAQRGAMVMKTSGRFLSTASLVVAMTVAASVSAVAQGAQGGMAPGMMRGDNSASDGMNANAPRGGTPQGAMGSGMMRGGMGQGRNCPMMGGGMGGGMMGQGMMSPGMAPGAPADLFGSRVTPMMNLSVDDVRAYLGVQLDRLHNARLKIGNVSAEDGTITADIVTVDNSLVQRLKVNRRTGAIKYED